MFQGEVSTAKCDEYLQSLLDEGYDYEASTFDCTNMFLFRGTDFRLWSVSIYYIIVTLTTCAALIPRLLISALRDSKCRLASLGAQPRATANPARMACAVLKPMTPMLQHVPHQFAVLCMQLHGDRGPFASHRSPSTLPKSFRSVHK